MKSLESNLGNFDTPKEVLNVFALRRAGQHAIMNWLGESLENSGVDVGHANNIYEHRHNESQRIEARASTGAEAIERSGSHDLIIANYEDATYSERHESPAYRDFHSASQVTARDIIIVRDYYNLLASRLAKKADIENNGRNAVGWRNPEDVEAAWMDHMTHGHTSPENPMLVSYNEWFSSKAYRKRLANLLDTESAEQALSTVPDFGGGSSFERRSHNGQAATMNVLSRWSSLSSESLVEEYALLIEDLDPATIRLNNEVFGIDKETVLGSLAVKYRT